MDIREAIVGQYLAGLKMMRQCIEKCPDDVWLSGKHPRNYWRIAFHALFYTHLYLMQKEEDFQPWQKSRETCKEVWEDEMPPVVDPYSQTDLLEYLDEIAGMVGPTVNALDLETEDTGFWWYKKMNKLDHQLMNFRHLQGHVGQLSEILMSHGIDIDWSGKAAAVS